MSPVAKALWFIESHSADPIGLAEIAAAANVTRYHLARAFNMATGWSAVASLRARRLTLAARKLADGAPDILALALEAGYGSHEAFTRAFRDQFGLTPEAVRERRHLNGIALVEAIIMESNTNVELEAPRFEQGQSMLLAGLGGIVNVSDSGGIPALWQRFAPYIGRIGGQKGMTAYGVISGDEATGDMDYVCAVEVNGFTGCPPELRQLTLAPQRYAVFRHRGHISGIRATWIAVMDGWLPGAGLRPVDAPFLERYGPDFNPQTGMGGLDILVPVPST